MAVEYQPIVIDAVEDCSAIAAAVEQYQRAMLGVLSVMLDRFERDPAYGLIDMKVDLLVGQDFAAGDPLRGKGVVYSWIQGRGLEALAGHAAWVADLPMLTVAQRQSFIERIHAVMRSTMQRMEYMRSVNGGRLSFMMMPTGQPLGIDAEGHVVAANLPADGPANFSELFYAKGLAAAAHALGDAAKLDEACRLLQRVCDEIQDGRFVSDQQPMDPCNPVRSVPGRYSVGPWMIAIGAAALLARITGDGRYRDLGLTLIEHILAQHVKMPDGSAAAHAQGHVQLFDMWEYVDDGGEPYFDEAGILRSDPGHATEFVGLALKLLRVCEEQGLMSDCAKQVAALRGTLGAVLKRNFDNGFTGRGICKAVDLIDRRKVNTDMPWWSLPETMRAALEAWAIAPSAERVTYATIARRCSNAFMLNFIRPDRWLMANQTINADGQPVAVIPATPDADPGYHTGLCLIDCFQLLRRAGLEPLAA